MDAKVTNMIKNTIALEWKIFARGTGFDGVDAVVDQIDHDMTKEKSKIEIFLKKLYQQHPNDYKTRIQNSLKVMGRTDLLQDIASLDAFLVVYVFFLQIIEFDMKIKQTLDLKYVKHIFKIYKKFNVNKVYFLRVSQRQVSLLKYVGLLGCKNCSPWHPHNFK